MRNVLIRVGAALAVLGVLVAVVSMITVSTKNGALEREKEAAGQEALNNSTANWGRTMTGQDPLGSKHDPGSIADTIDTWKTWRNVGFGVAGLGATVMVVGYQVPQNPQPRSRATVSGWASPTGMMVRPSGGVDADDVQTADRPAAEPGPSGVEERLATLARLRDSGTITTQEYDERRSRILDDL